MYWVGLPVKSMSLVHPVGSSLRLLSKLWTARPICFRLLVHCVRRAASRAACTAGSNRATKMPIMAITTSSSTR